MNNMQNKCLKIKTEQLKNMNKKQVALLQVFCNLEITLATARWYTGEAQRSDLPSHESIICLALMIASIGEALVQFDKLKEKNIVQYSNTWEQKTKDGWNLLNSSEVISLKKTCLKHIRDKSAFHFDSGPIKNGSEAIACKTDDVSIWEIDESNKTGFSPLVALLIAENITGATPNQKIAELTMRVYDSLNNIIKMLILEFFETYVT